MKQLKDISSFSFFIGYRLNRFCTIGNKYSVNSFHFNDSLMRLVKIRCFKIQKEKEINKCVDNIILDCYITLQNKS